ncbi:MAG: tetratricopeptide repeat protein [Planctomycetota bacterium]
MATSMNNLARVMQDQGELQRARELHEKTLELRRRLLGEEHPDVATSMNHLASVIQDQGDLREARELYEKTLELYRRLLGEEHPRTLVGKAFLIRCAAEDGTGVPEDTPRELASILRQLLTKAPPNSVYPVWVGRMLRESGGDPVSIVREAVDEKDAAAYAALLDGPQYPGP